MFEYCSRNLISITSTIGSFISHKMNWYDKDGNILSQEEINKWDRSVIAKRYLDEYYCPPEYEVHFDTIAPEHINTFLREVEEVINNLIPKRYFIKYCKAKKLYSDDTRELSDMFKGKEYYDFTKKLI